MTIQNVDYLCIIHKISKSDPSNLLESAVLEKHGYIYIKYIWVYCLKCQSMQKIFSFFVLFCLVYIK